MPAKRGALFQVCGAMAVAVLSAVAWFAWLGWDDEYQTDPATGVASGPYQVWQIAGCGVSLLILLVGAELAGVRALPASAALTLGFTGAWTIDAARSDETGLFGVGAVMLLAGLCVGSALVSGAVIGLRDRRGARRS
ncbi:hypothetical protein QLQ12_09440 [Actinoplanes sp. NEAU-A12]|uniref:Integral membrane protein n=1 Tax=Actinoplanes sandaracinus TaxID=3045177 RepID=A0ABT6WGG9_9ACTN|nr:hypothetical protein [Actinoplanes sandaracinus]MDI6098821.1 hypothetical protein [Actinoplanes sandaracinus]